MSWKGERQRHSMSARQVLTTRAMEKTINTISSVWKPGHIKSHIENEMLQHDPADLEYDVTEHEFMLWVDTISSGAAGRYQPGEIATVLGLKLPKDAKDVNGNPVDNWDDYEFAWEDIERATRNHEDWLNNNVGLKGRLVLGHSEYDGDYGLMYFWHAGDHPVFDSRYNSTVKWREAARKEIEQESNLALDVAYSHDQIFDNVKHTRWFRDAVAEQIREGGGR